MTEANSLEGYPLKEQMASVMDKQQLLFKGPPNQGDHQRKPYKRRRAKVRRSKSQGYRQDSHEFTDALKGNFDGSSDEDIDKLKEQVKFKGRSNRKVVMFDWDKSPFVFSVDGNVKDSGLDKLRAPKLVKCKNIATIDEEDESDSVQDNTRTGK